MDKMRKKQLQAKYKAYYPPMGVYMIKSKVDEGFVYLSSTNLPGAFNSVRFQLNLGSYPNKGLQKAWQEQGADAFEFQLIEELEYDKNDLDKDYRPDLTAMVELLLEELSEQKRVKMYR